MTSDLRTRRPVSIILWILQGLAAVIFLFAALGKFTGVPQSVASFHALGIGDWLRYVVGILEVIGLIALLIPTLCGLAALALTLLMIGATLTQVFAVGTDWVLPLVTLIIVAIIAWGRWPRTIALIDRLRPADRRSAA